MTLRRSDKQADCVHRYITAIGQRVCQRLGGGTDTVDVDAVRRRTGVRRQPHTAAREQGEGTGGVATLHMCERDSELSEPLPQIAFRLIGLSPGRLEVLVREEGSPVL